MKPRSEKSMELYRLMERRGYPEEFCDIVTQNLNTDFTARRMIGYLSHYDHPPLEEIADEMLAILSDRNRIMPQHSLVNRLEPSSPTGRWVLKPLKLPE